MKEVFISYSSHDQGEADEIVAMLEQNGISCFIAHRDNVGGGPFSTQIIHAIKECRLCLLVAGENINDSRHVEREIHKAFNEKKAILPVVIRPFTLSETLDYYLDMDHRIAAYPHALSRYGDTILLSVKKHLSFALGGEEPQEALREEKGVISFDYDHANGIMTNPEDHHRNVSFRVDTLIRLMAGIYDRVKGLSGEEEAEKIFFEVGCAGGKGFAERYPQWESGFDLPSLQRNFDRWCRFDSAVGWGAFRATVEADEEKDTVFGTVSIKAPFLVDNENKRKICAFLRGYCAGVIGVLLRTKEPELSCGLCPLNRRMANTCEFHFLLK